MLKLKSDYLCSPLLTVLYSNVLYWTVIWERIMQSLEPSWLLQSMTRRGRPGSVTSDKGSQLTSRQNYIVFGLPDSPKCESLKEWNWEKDKTEGTKKGTLWQFVEAGCQWHNGLVENWVKKIKKMFGQVVEGAIVKGQDRQSPTLTYA